MLYTFGSGFLVGFLMCISFGTVFFALIQNSIDNGYISGIKISIGGILSDIMFILIALFGASFLPEIQHFTSILMSVGGFLLIVMGIVSWSKKSPKLLYPETKIGDWLYYIGLGFMLNSINPINFVIWATAATSIKDFDNVNTFAYFCGSLSAVFLTQFIICYYAVVLQKHFTPKLILWINRTAGTVFAIGGFVLLYKVLTTIF